DLATCGNGVVDAGCGEACDDGAGNGIDHCCSVTCNVVDTDGDGVCDRDDPCTGPAPVAKPKVVIGKLDTPPGDDKLTVKRSMTVSLSSPGGVRSEEHTLNSSHVASSYAVFCLKKKKTRRRRICLAGEPII